MNDLNNKRVLIAAHDHRLIGNLQNILASQAVEIASSGSMCLSMIDEFQPELLLLQMFLSDMDAFDLLTKASERCSCTPQVVLFTSAHPGEAATQFAALHIAGTILKSESLETLRQQLQPYFDNALPSLTASGAAVYITNSSAKAEQYTHILETNGYQVFPAETPETATGLIQQLAPELVL
ncbi:response regulator, partial [bacterium]|nr:response regulator [bacterium]